MKTEILRLLRESEGFLSGQQLCSRFQVSRAAVWKVMEQLKDEGYEIQAVRNKGYRLVGSPDVLSREELESRISTRWAGRHVVYFPQTDSTNLQAKAAGEGGSPSQSRSLRPGAEPQAPTGDAEDLRPDKAAGVHPHCG